MTIEDLLYRDSVTCPGCGLVLSMSKPARAKALGAAKEKTQGGAKATAARATLSALDFEKLIGNIVALYAYAANDKMTWASVTAMIANVLTELWTQGELSGSTPGGAFSVQCGVGSTMTGQDILDGVMVVQVALLLRDRADFVELTFRQPLQAGS